MNGFVAAKGLVQGGISTAGRALEHPICRWHHRAVLRRSLFAVLVFGSIQLGAFAQDAWRPAHSRQDVALGRSFVGVVGHVADGDTIDVVRRDGRVVRIRIEGIDCPERGQPFSKAATTFTRQLVLDRTVEVYPIARDRRYDRLVARIVIGGKDVGLEVVRVGLAWHFLEYSSDRALNDAERNARQSRRGIWSEPNPTPPWVARRKSSPTEVGIALNLGNLELRANARSRVYHLPTCKNANCSSCSIQFISVQDARAAGFRPAGDCLRH
jgi:micrococcal nuclease